MRTKLWPSVFLPVFLFLAAMPAVFAAADEANLPPADLNRVKEGVVAPDFTLEDLSGQQVTLSGFRGKKKVVLVFYRGYW